MDTPLLRVSRPVSACARCRNAKIRCDGKLPACSACERAGKSAECSSANDSFAKGKERSYVSSLELRIERLEKQVAQAKAQKAGVSSDQPNLAVKSISNTKRSSQVAEASDVDELVSDFGYLVLNATSTGYNGFDKEMSFARLAISTATVQALPAANDINLPVRSITTELIQECMQNILSVYPVLTEASIYGSLEAMYQHNGQYSSPLDVWNIRLVIAIGLSSRSRSRDTLEYHDACRHAAVALEQAEAVLQPGITVTTQAVLLLSLYSILDPAHFSPWYLLSIAVRVWLDIGLHQEPAHLKRPVHVVQNHRRLFYCMYSLDRAITFSYVRLLSFMDDAVDVDLPNNPALPRAKDISMMIEAEKESGGYFVLLTRLRQAESSQYQKLFGSRRDMIYEPWYSRAQDMLTIRQIFVDLTTKTTEAQNHVLSLDFHYFNVLLLRPLETQVVLDPYGIHLLFDSSVLYASTLYWLIQRSKFFICCTSLELLRATRVSQYFMSLLKDHSSPVFEDITPRLPSNLFDSQAPAIMKRSPTESVTAVVEFCSNMEYALDNLGQRFGRPPNYHNLMEEIGTNLHVFRTRQRSYHMQANHDNRKSYHAANQSYGEGSWQTYQGPTHHS